MRRPPDPPRETIDRIVDEEVSRFPDMTPGEVFGNSTRDLIVLVRRRSMARIVEETGCSYAGLARVWGCHHTSPQHLLSQQPFQRMGRKITPWSERRRVTLRHVTDIGPRAALASLEAIDRVRANA